MLKKIYNIAFVVAFLMIIMLPFLFAQRGTEGGVSANENRNLSKSASLFSDGKFNWAFPQEYEAWFKDRMGFREELINSNAWIQYHIFHRFLDGSDYYLGVHDDLNYATKEMLADYQRINLRSEEQVRQIGESYQILSDYVEERGAQFYYFQCWDKHSIYPEQFMSGVYQLADFSKTDQIVQYFRENTSVKVFSAKESLLESKAEYEVYSNWGDPTHWTQRGAYIGYRGMMDLINTYNDHKFKVLDEEDYDIDIADMGKTFNGYIHVADPLEVFRIGQPSAVKSDDRTPMGSFAEDVRHGRWVNPNAGNDAKLLIMGDSYINSYIVEDFAESFAETWMIWGDYTLKLEEVLDLYNPDIVIYECAERVDRSRLVCDLAKKISEKK